MTAEAFVTGARIGTRRKGHPMRLMKASLFSALVFGLAACGDNPTERAATGGLGGAVVAGPAGAIVGGTVGAATAE